MTKITSEMNLSPSNTLKYTLVATGEEYFVSRAISRATFLAFIEFSQYSTVNRNYLLYLTKTMRLFITKRKNVCFITLLWHEPIRNEYWHFMYISNYLVLTFDTR